MTMFSFRSCFGKLALATLAGLAGFAGLASPVVAQTHPLAIDGKPTVFQRVLTRGHVDALTAPDGAVAQSLYAFSPLYVYAKQDAWVQVGRAATAPEFWLKDDQVVAWNQNIVAAFTNPSNRSRQVMFDTVDGLRALMNHENVAAMQAELLQQADENSLEPASGVNSVEPANFVDIQDHFYVLPILGYVSERHPLSVNENLLLNVASIPDTQAPPDRSADDFDAGVVFVIDTTQSMDPYIRRCRAMLEQIVQTAGTTDVGKRINFGIIGFRDDPSVAAGVEYRVKEFAPLMRRDSNDPVVAAIGTTKAAAASTRGFNEDSIAGVSYALNQTEWAPGGKAFDGRFIILVTDAGPNMLGDPGAESDLDAASLNVVAQDKGVVILTLHLLTAAGGGGNHAYAKTEYQNLSKFGDHSFYYSIPDGSEQDFQAQGDKLLLAITDQIRDAMGQAPQQAAADVPDGFDALGPALRLAWLGRQQGTEAPAVISSWVSQLSVEDGVRNAVSPRLLVTKNQLATMAEFLDGFITLGEQLESSEGAATFFTQIREMVLRMSQNPDRLVNPTAEGVGDAMEFLQDLPYRSELLGLTADTWMASPDKRRSVLDGLRPKLAQYRNLLNDATVWTSIYTETDPGDQVYAMPLELLP